MIEQLKAALLAKAVAAKVVKTDKVRADSTVVPANVAYPTDSGLLVRAIVAIVTLVARVHAGGAASRTRVRDRRRAAGRRARSISAHLKLRNEQAKASVLGDHRRAGRPDRGQRHRGQQGAGQCPPPCCPPRCGHPGAAGLGDR